MSLLVSKLNDRSLISVRGEQASEYLHGQLTVATQNFDHTKARLAAHCDFKGKMFSAMFVSQFNENFCLSMPQDAAQESLSQLKKYGVFSKVEITLNDEYQIIGLSGDNAQSTLQQLFPDIAEHHLGAYESKFGQCICFKDTSIRYLCYLTNAACEFLLETLQLDEFSASQYFDYLEIEAGIADVRGENIGQFVPQMLNYQCLQAIDFDKGCYMGQEVVARTKFLGKNKRAAFILEADDVDHSMKAGAQIEVKLGENWRRAGIVLKAAQKESKDKPLAIAVMANDTAIDSMLRLKDTHQGMKIKPLPYELTD